jgi:predicted nucleic acid-binding protein
MASRPSVNSAANKVTRQYVIDANVAIDAFVPENLFSSTKDRRVYEASYAFIARAVHHGAVLFVPNLFFGEVANVISRDAVNPGLISSEDGARLVNAIFSGVDWQAQIPDYDRVFALTAKLQRKRTGDSEYLALAETLDCELITGDERLVRAVTQAKLAVRVIDVCDHVWRKDGDLDANPPSE